MGGYPYADWEAYCEAHRRFFRDITKDMHVDAILENGLWESVLQQENVGKKTREALLAFMEDNGIKP